MPGSDDGTDIIERYDERKAIADRLDQLDDPDEKESFDEVFAEFDEQFGSDQ